MLGIGIHNNKLDATDARVDHVVDSISAGASNSNNFNAGKRLDFGADFGHKKYKVAIILSPGN